MKRNLFLLLSLFWLTLSHAQTVSHEFNDVSLSDALLTLENDCDTITVNFIYQELEDFIVTTNIQDATVLQAVKQVCGSLPIRVTQLNTDIFVECTQKDTIRFIGQVLDSRRHPLPHATVVLLSANRDTLNQATTNADGYFVIPCLERQAFVKVSHPMCDTFEKFYNHDEFDVITLTTASVEHPAVDETAEQADNPAIHRSYHSLWRQAYKHSVADLPRSQLDVLNTIRTKARKENNHGMMTAAELMRASIIKELEPDSLPGIVHEIMEEERLAESNNPLLATAYQVILLNIPPVKGIDATQFEPFREKIMANTPLLAASQDEMFRPLVSIGDDGGIFGNDLLSVVGMQTHNYQLLHDHYGKLGNRRAEMLTALWMLDKNYHDSRGCIISDKHNHYLTQLDSLCTQYADLPECCEIAILRYKAMCEKKDVTVEEKMQYIDTALQRWGEWRNANELRNERAELSEPMMSVEIGEARLLPDSSRVIRFHQVRNVREVTLRISRLDISPTKIQSVAGRELTKYEYRQLLEKTKPVEVATYKKEIHISNDFVCVEDSMRMPGLPVGRYLAECYAEGCTFDTLRYQLMVSDVFMLLEPLPKRKTKVVVVRGSTGQPLPGAKVTYYNWKKEKTRTANGKGELILRNKNGGRFHAAVEGDEHAPSATLYSSFSGASWRGKQKRINIYTDRAIYRPGQKVNVAMVAFQNKANKEIISLKKKRLTIHVTDPNYTKVADTTLVTDEFGTASFAFDIPTDRMNGDYRISVSAGRHCHGFQLFKVEEYKIPTFSVELATMAEAEITGDAILLPGHAKAFSGAQVTHAQVCYTVEQKRGQMTRSMNWNVAFKDTIQTDADGGFKVKIPVVVQKVEDTEDQWSFRVKAVVTDLGGESHEAERTIPMKDKERLFNILLQEKKMEMGKPMAVTLDMKDRWMEPVDTMVEYYVDTPDEKHTAKTNESIQLVECDALRLSGVHTLYAVCGNDTTKAQFYVVNYDDVRPGTFTKECFAQSATRFPDDGGEVRVQLGTSMEDVYVIYDIFADNKHLEGGSFTLSNQMYNRKFVYQPEYGSGLCLTFAFVKDGVVYTEKALIEAPLTDHSLQMKWETFRDRLTPGQKEEWTLRITHPDGTPAKAQLLSVLYDAALDKLKEHDWWANSQMLGFHTSNTEWHYDRFGLSSRKMLPKVRLRNPVKPLDFSHFNYDLLSMQANETTLAEIAKVSKVMNKGKRRYGKRGYLMGIVVDETGEPVIGATIIPSRSGKGTITNIDGEFEIKTTEDAYVKVSYIGYLSQTVMIHNGTYVVIELTEDNNALEEVVVVGYGTQKKKTLTGSIRVRGASSEKFSAPVIKYDQEVKALPADDDEQKEANADVLMTLRENMEETAFFQPSLVSSDDGMMKIQFTLPESVTTWRFLGMAHDQNMNIGRMDCTAIAQKDVMVQPNMPRFVRKGDHATIVARIANISATPKDGTAEMVLSDAETGEVVYTEKKDFNIDGNTTTSIPFSFIPGEDSEMLTCRTMVSGTNFSDGEQRWLPVLPDREMTIDSHVFTLHAPGQTVVDVDSMMTGSLPSSRKMMIEYTENPSWMMVLAMPTYTARPNDDAISQAVALYANIVGGSIMNASPSTMQRLRQWDDKDTSRNPFLSELEKNEEIKEMLLRETPWTISAQSETSMRRSLVEFFDQQTMKKRIDKATSRLKDLQCSDGGWAWWKGMPSSEYATLAVMETLARLHANLTTSLNKSGVKYDLERMLEKGMQYLDKVAVEQVFEMKEDEKTLVEANKKPRSTRSATILLPTEELLHYLYISSLLDNHPDSDVLDAREYLLDYVRNKNLDLTIYGKAVFAVIMAKNGQEEKAHDYLKSLKEYAVTSPDKGMYFDTPKAYYSWCDYRIPTVTMAIEALQMVEPGDKETVELMRKWLLSQKRVQKWDCELNAVNAIQAFFGDDKMEMEERLENRAPATISLGGKAIDAGTAIEGLGYVRMVVTDSVGGKLCFDKKSEQTSWATVSTQSMRRVADIGDASMGMTVKREILNDNTMLKVGDKVKVRITIEADQDYDFVQVVDKRAACMEPVDIISGYRNGCYQVKKDNVTQYYFTRLRKGTTTIETEYYIDRAGRYETGTCTAQCAYSPAFSARAASITVDVE